MTHLFLFDVDSVLVEARGYLVALQETVAHFSLQMGLGSLPPTEEEVRAFEANGLTSEWDSGAACVAALLVERVRREPALALPGDWPAALQILAAKPLPLPPPDYAALARRAGSIRGTGDGVSAAQAVHAALVDEVWTLPGAGASLLELLDTLLGHTHDLYRAPVTRYFQHLAIGSQAVAETYGITPDLTSPPYLRDFDRPLLSLTTRSMLKGVAAVGRVRAALYTARPSLPPADVDAVPSGYSPEAEMARALVGLETWPLIGMGRMQWLADRSGRKVEQLVKPSPVQALAAIGAAWSGQEAEALQAALALHDDGKLLPPLSDLNATAVHVFEDATVGLAAVERAVEALGRVGVNLAWRAYGVVPAAGPKMEAMMARGVAVYPSVNEAVMAALSGTR